MFSDLDAIMNHHMSVWLGSVAWAGHLIHVVWPTSAAGWDPLIQSSIQSSIVDLRAAIAITCSIPYQVIRWASCMLFTTRGYWSHCLLGSPRVGCETSEDSNLEWLDIYQRLSLEGIYMLVTKTVAESINSLVGSLLHWTHGMNRSLLINGSGGDAFSGSSLADWVISPDRTITTLVVGWAASTAGMILWASNNRCGMKHSRVVMHNLELITSGRILSMQRVAHQIWRMATRQQAMGYGWRYLRASTSRSYVSAQTALEWSILNLVV